MRGALRQRIEPLLSKPNPGLTAGADLKEDPRYDALRAEIARFENGQPVDWNRVGQQGRVVLSHLVKDAVTAAYVAYGEHLQRGLLGLADGAALLAALTEEQWEQLHPPRDRGRANAIEWFLGRVKADFATRPPSGEGLAEARAALEWLGAAATARLGANAPKVSTVTDLFPATNGAPTAAAPPPAPPPVAPTAPPVAIASAPVHALPPEIPLPPTVRRAERWLKPIPGEAPAGQSARYDARYDRVRKEVEKLQSMSGGAVDFQVVKDESGALLESVSKDLVMASYLAGALGVLEGLEGWRAGIDLLGGLLEQYWLTLFPEVSRQKARGNAIGWWIDFARPRLLAFEAKASDRAPIDALAVEAKKLWEIAGKCFDSDGPSFRPLLETIERLRMSVPTPAPSMPPPLPPPLPSPTPAAPPVAVASAPRPAPALEAPTAAFEDLAGVSAFLGKVGASILPAARAIREASTADPTSYRLLRTGLWLHLSSVPPSNNGKTSIPAPPADLRKKLDLMLQSQKLLALLEESESALGQHRLWIDLNHYTDRALSGLGPTHERARQALQAAVLEMTSRLPGLDRLTYADGSPLASADAQAWLKDLQPSAAGGGSTPPTKTSVDPAREAVLAEARALVKQGQLTEALVKIEERARSEASASVAFELRLAAAELTRSSGQVAAARALYAALDREAKARGLDEWSPEVASEMLRGYLQALKAGTADPSRRPEIEALTERLGRIDPRALLVIFSA